jgi:YD repeat-containing protein
VAQLTASVHGEETTTSFITHLDYNAKGQRTLIEYGNGASTRYEYDPETFRLTHLSTIQWATRQAIAAWR